MGGVLLIEVVIIFDVYSTPYLTTTTMSTPSKRKRTVTLVSGGGKTFDASNLIDINVSLFLGEVDLNSPIPVSPEVSTNVSRFSFV